MASSQKAKASGTPQGEAEPSLSRQWRLRAKREKLCHAHYSTARINAALCRKRYSDYVQKKKHAAKSLNNKGNAAIMNVSITKTTQKLRRTRDERALLEKLSSTGRGAMRTVIQ